MDEWIELTDEHIIPRQIGGVRMVLSASCPHHQAITCKIENACERQYFYNVRRHLGLIPVKNNKFEQRYTGILMILLEEITRVSP